MNRIDRLFGILTLLQSRKYVTAEVIAEKFNISVRTVYRDVKALTETGTPVCFEPSKGYYIVRGYFLPPVSFNPDEANAMLIMESLAYGFTDKSIQQHYSTALAKIKSVLKTSDKDNIEKLQENIRLQMPSCFNYNYEFLSGIQRAITSQKIIEIAYKNKTGEAGKREIEPIGLIFYALNWHLIAWCHKRNEYRDFRVSRIERLVETQQPFTRTEHVALADYMEQIPVEY